MSKTPETILWLGGPAAAGKTTVALLLAQKHGLHYYSLDAHARPHEERAAAAGLHVLGTGPGDFDRKPMIMDDLEALRAGVVVLVEGAAITPTMAGTADNALWLMPSQDEQLARLQRRHPEGIHHGYAWGWTLIQSQLEGTSAIVLTVDGQSIDQTLAAVEQQFSALLPTAKARR
ncbi:hypothetical protein ACIA49_23535 [Kribbella sp. NPDC051587]|uniref:hypothetical protein n=1 Tax=Kribbella sp. NPDC051587 TaxID=3364119 RepID=UPI00379B5802